jgi:acid stress-induced BolA-like protein IbaG/YrbA
MRPEEIKRMIEAGIADCDARVEGDDGRHYTAVIISPLFVGRSMLEQHKMVYAALGNSMESAIHAFSMRTYTPEQWQQAQQRK